MWHPCADRAASSSNRPWRSSLKGSSKAPRQKALFYYGLTANIPFGPTVFRKADLSLGNVAGKRKQPGEPGAWHLVQLKPNAQHIARRNLERQGIAVFQPLIEQGERRRGHFATVMKPLFPGYLFVRIAPDSGLIGAVNSTLGVARLVCFGSSPARVPQPVIRALQNRCDPDGALLPEGAFEGGEQVRLATGPFASFIAKVECAAADQRAWLLLDLMGREARIAVPSNALRRA